MKICLISILLFVTMEAAAQTEPGNSAAGKPLVYFNIKKPLFQLEREREQVNNTNRFLRFAALTGYREGVTPTTTMIGYNQVLDKAAGTKRVYMINQSLEEIISLGIFLQEEIILEVRDPSKFRYNPANGSQEEWLRKNGYCFEFMLPIEAYGNLKGGVINGLRDQAAGLIGVSWSIEKRTVNGVGKDYLIIKEN